MLKLICSLSILLAASFSSAHQDMQKAPAMPKDFERIKAFAGTWVATSKMGDKVDTGTISFEVTAGGTAIMERLFAGTPHEMVSIYHARNNQTALTHYCVIGNQPEMVLKEATDKKLVFDMKDTTGLTSATETHMHSLTISMIDANHLTEEWVSYEGGKKKDVKTLSLARK